MNPNEPLDDQALRTLMESLPMSANAPENLKNKLVDLAASSAPTRRAARRPILALALSAATIVTAIAVITSIPTPAAAKSWEGVKRAVESVQKMELIVTDPRTNQIRSQTRVDPSSIYVKLWEGDELYVTDRLVRTFDKSDNLMLDVVMPENGAEPDIRKQVLKELSMSTILAQYEEKYGTRYIKIGPIHDQQGRQVYDVTLREPNSVGYGNLVIDATSNLPIYLEAFEPQDGKPVKTLEMSARFNDGATSPGQGPVLPKGARHETIPVSKVIEQNHGEMPKLNFSFRRLLRG